MGADTSATTPDAPHPPRATPSQPGSPAGTRTGRIALMTAGLALATALLLANLAALPFGRDQGIFAVVAETMARGGAPYADAWDFKTPGVFFVYALARWIFGAGETAFRMFEILSLLMMGAGFWVLSRRVFTGAAAAAGLLIAVFNLTLFGFWHVGQPETFGAVVLTWAVVLATARPTSAPARYAAAAGAAALYAVAASLKPPLGGGIVVSFAFAVHAALAAGRGRAEILRLTLAHAAGAGAVLAAIGGYFAATGALDAFLWTLFEFAPGYTATGGPGLADLPMLIAKAGWRCAKLWPLLPVGLALLVLLGPRTGRLWGTALHIGGVTAFALIGVAVQGKFFPYHFAAAVGLGSVVAGWGFWALWLRLLPHRWAGVAVVTILALLMVATPASRRMWQATADRVAAMTDPALAQAVSDRLYSTDSMDRASNRAAATWIDATAPPDARIQIWGFEPLVYLYSGRQPASRFLYNVPQRAAWSAERTRADLMATLEAAPPWAILVQSGDRMPAVTGSTQDSREALADFPALERFLAERYAPAATFGVLEIHTLRGADRGG